MLIFSMAIQITTHDYSFNGLLRISVRIQTTKRKAYEMSVNNAFTFISQDSLSNASIIELLKQNKVITIRNRQSNKIGLIMKYTGKEFNAKIGYIWSFRFKVNDKDHKADVADDPAIFIIDALRHLQGCYFTQDTSGAK